MTPAKFRIFVTATLCVATASSAAEAKDLVVPTKRYRTIQSALDASQAGDRVLVRGGVHAGAVVATDGVALVGRGARLFGETRIEGDRVTVRGFRFVKDGHVVVTGDDAVVSDGVFERSTGGKASFLVQGGARATFERNRGLYYPTIQVDAGKGAVLRGNRFHGGDVLVLDDQAVVESNTGFEFDIRLFGRGHVVRANRTRSLFTYEGGDSTISDNTAWRFIAEGDRNVIARNVVAETLAVVGDDVSVRANRLPRTPSGIWVTGSRAEVSDNVVNVSTVYANEPGCPNMTLEATASSGIHVEAPEPGGVVERNRVTHAHGLGIVVSVGGAAVRGNVVVGASSITSIVVVGSGNTVTGNDVAQHGRETAGGRGIDVTGDANTIEGNHVVGTSSDAIVVQTGSDNAVTGNVVERSRGCGIMVGEGAVGTTVEDCVVTGGQLGLVNQGEGTSIGGSTLTGNRWADVLDADPTSGALLLDGNTIGSVSRDAFLLNAR